MQTQGEHANSAQMVDSNPGPSCCEAAVLIYYFNISYYNEWKQSNINHQIISNFLALLFCSSLK